MPDLSQRLTTALSDRYRIERELGRGGMATVFLAEDLKHHRRVAIKVLDPEVGVTIGPERFLREIETVAQLTHPHILPLHDSGVADGLLFYVMPYVEGESLHDRLTREKQLPLEDALRITREVADALDFAHQRGVVHRDIKPGNILLESGHAVVADFGIARAVDTGEVDTEAETQRARPRTTAGMMLGTPAYMSPEQAAGSRNLDGRSDLYSLGCVLYEMLAGQPLFAGLTLASQLYQHLNVTPRPVTELRPAVPTSVAAALQRALAKTPADRYATTGEFAVALERGLAEPAAKPRGHVARWIALAVVAGVAVLAAVVAWQQWPPFGGKGATPPAKRDWILVADFDGPPGDSTLAPAAQSLLSAALDQSRILATVPPDQIQQALRMAGKPVGTRVNAALARELAYRSAVRAVLEGKISRLGRGYVIVLKVVDADTARVLLTRSGTARNDDDLIPVLGELAKKLRRGLGENRTTLAATRSMSLIATPSFEAYQLFVRAGERYRVQTGNRMMLRYLHAALALDPDFASARLAMADAYIPLMYPDSARACIAEALRRPDRLTLAQREGAEITLASLDGDYARAVAARDRILADDPGNVAVLANSNDDLCVEGRFEDALERTRRAMKLSPFGPADAMRLNEATSLFYLGRFDEAREANQQQTGIHKVSQRLWIELAAGRFAVAESIATANLDDPLLTEDAPEGNWPKLALARFGRGAVSGAAEAMKSLVAVSRRANDPWGMYVFPRFWIEYRVVSEGAISMPPDVMPRDSSTGALLTRGLDAAARRDRAVALRCLGALQARPRRDLALELIGMPLLEARLEAMSGRPNAAVRLLRPLAWSIPTQATSLTWAEWWLADAYEQIGRPDSAAWCLERLASVAFSSQDGAERPYVHRRLALLDAKLGRVADAERHLAAAEKALDQPDPVVRRMLDEARAAVRSARAMARPERAGT